MVWLYEFVVYEFLPRVLLDMIILLNPFCRVELDCVELDCVWNYGFSAEMDIAGPSYLRVTFAS